MKYAIIAALLILQGCSPEEIDSTFVYPDPDIGIVETRVFDQTEFVQLEEPILTISEERSMDLLFGRISDVKILSNGVVIVADSRSHCLVYISPEGGFITRVGRRGAGPGELNLSSRGRLSISKGDTVNLIDERNGRISQYSSDGIWIKSYRLNTIPMDFAVFDDGSLLLSLHASSSVLVHTQPGADKAVTILKREGFTGAGSYLANGWLLETIGKRIYLYHETSGLILHSRSIESPFHAVYLQDDGYRALVKSFINSDEPAQGSSLDIRSFVMVYGLATDIEKDHVYIQLGDEQVGDYRRLVQMDKNLRYLRGWKIPNTKVSRGIAARDGHLFTFSSTAVYKWF